MKIELIDLELIKPYERNPRTHPKEQVKKLAKSIEEFGFKIPILVDRNNKIIAGHGRYLAAKHLGLKKVPVIKAEDLTPEQAKAFRIADNRLALESDWDLDLLGLELQDLANSEYDISLTMLDDKEIGFFIQTAMQSIVEENLEEEWKGMPEFISEDQTAVRKLIVNFQSESAVEDFCNRLGISITDKTKSIWFPPKERMNRKDYAWVSDEEAIEDFEAVLEEMGDPEE